MSQRQQPECSHSMRLRVALAFVLWCSVSEPALAVITTTLFYLSSTRSLSLQVGKPTGVDNVRFDVGGVVGNSQAYAAPVSGSGLPMFPSNQSGGILFRVFMQLPLDAVLTRQQVITTVSNPAYLVCIEANCAGYAIPFQSIAWTVAPASTFSGDIQDGTFVSGGGTHTLINYSAAFGSTVEFKSTLNFSYANTTIYPAGTYTGTVTYTTSLP